MGKPLSRPRFHEPLLACDTCDGEGELDYWIGTYQDGSPKERRGVCEKCRGDGCVECEICGNDAARAWSRVTRASGPTEAFPLIGRYPKIEKGDHLVPLCSAACLHEWEADQT